MWLLKFALVLGALYVVFVGALYFAQTHLIFPRGLVAEPEAPLPATAHRLEIATPDGDRLHGVRIPPLRQTAGEPLTILGFGGNAWHADSLALYLHEQFPDAVIVAFHYRGYGPSTGTPGARSILADALRVHDGIAGGANTGDGSDTGGAGRIVAVGFSLGAAVASYLAAERPVAGLIVVSPFDSLSALAQQHYPWVPIRWLLRHRIPTAEFARTVTAPTALIAAAADTIVPPNRTAPLRQAFPALVLDRVIANTDHIDIYQRPEFRDAMTEALARIGQ